MEDLVVFARTQLHGLTTGFCASQMPWANSRSAWAGLSGVLYALPCLVPSGTRGAPVHEEPQLLWITQAVLSVRFRAARFVSNTGVSGVASTGRPFCDGMRIRHPSRCSLITSTSAARTSCRGSTVSSPRAWSFASACSALSTSGRGECTYRLSRPSPRPHPPLPAFFSPRRRATRKVWALTPSFNLDVGISPSPRCRSAVSAVQASQKNAAISRCGSRTTRSGTSLVQRYLF